MHLIRIQPAFYFSLIPIAVLIQIFIWFIGGQVDIKFMKPIARKADPVRFWFIIVSGLAIASISLSFFLFKWITDPAWQ
jgi:hypothetical protein